MAQGRDDWGWLLGMLLRQPIRSCQDQLAGLFKAHKTLGGLTHYNLFNNSFYDFDNRFGQRTATAAATRSIIPLDEFAAAATNLPPFLIHDVTS